MNDSAKSAIIRDLNDKLRNCLATGKITGGASRLRAFGTTS